MAFIGSGASLTNLPAPSSANVGTANAGLSVGAVGTWGFLRNFSGGNVGTGSTTAGSGIKYAAADGQEASAASGTWRCMGVAYTGGENGTTCWLRTA